MGIKEAAIGVNLDRMSQLIQDLTQEDLEIILADLIVDKTVNDDMIIAILSRMKDINKTNKDGITPLMAAILFRSFNLINYLVEDRQANVNILAIGKQYGFENMRSLDMVFWRTLLRRDPVNQEVDEKADFDDEGRIMFLLLSKGAISNNIKVDVERLEG